jgi:hypothetical protein
LSGGVAVPPTLSLIVLSPTARMTSRDLISFSSSRNFLGAVPRPDVFIYCCRVRHNARERKQTRICIPQGLGVGLLPVGTEDVATPGFQCPLVSFFVSLDVDRDSGILLRYGDREERGGTKPTGNLGKRLASVPAIYLNFT